MAESTGPGSPGGRHSWAMKYPSRSRQSGQHSASFLQGTLMIIMFTTHFQWAASQRDESITVPDTVGPWNKSFKTERGCSNFHWANVSSYFYYWPEDDPHFAHCCAFGDLIPVNYTYGKFGPPLSYATYYDLGLIDQCLPYWKCGRLFERFYEISIVRLNCEFTDLRALYSRRFWGQTVLNRGLLQSALPFILSLEVLVILFVALYWVIWRRPGDGLKHIIKGATSKDWFRAMHKTLVADWTHLCLLAIIGNGLVEAVGHQNAYASQSKSFYNYARLYVVLTILVWQASFLQQLSYWIAVIEDHYQEYFPPLSFFL